MLSKPIPILLCRLHLIGISDEKSQMDFFHRKFGSCVGSIWLFFPSVFRNRTCFIFFLMEKETIGNSDGEKTHACSESSRCMLGSIELPFSRLVVVFYVTTFWTVGIRSDRPRFSEDLRRRSAMYAVVSPNPTYLCAWFLESVTHRYSLDLTGVSLLLGQRRGCGRDIFGFYKSVRYSSAHTAHV